MPKTYALLVNNKIFATMFLHEDQTDIFGKFQAAFETGVTGMEVTNMPEVQEGWIWDGKKFNSPSEVNNGN